MASSFSIGCPPCSQPLLKPQASWGLLPPDSVSFPSLGSSSSLSRHRIVCMAKPETVEKVCTIVKKQLALGDDQVVNGESKLTALGADSLDTVEIVMGLEEEFGITVEEENAQNIATIEDAADMIENLVAKSG